LIAQLDARSMNSGPDGIGRQLARGGDFFVTESGDFAHQEHVAVEGRERGQRLVHGRADILMSGPRRRVRQRRRLRMSCAAPVVIQYEVSGDPKEPRAPVAVDALLASADAQKDFLRQIAGGIAAADGPAEVPENLLVVRDEQPL